MSKLQECQDCYWLVPELSEPSDHSRSCYHASVHIGTTAAEESLIRAAIAHCESLGLRSGKLVDAVNSVKRERNL